jgi:hypothetical protein
MLNRIHALAASVIIGLAGVFGVAAATKTAGIGGSKPAANKVSDQTIAARQLKLDRAQAALRKARNQKPPALPAVPASPAAAPQAQLVAQPAPVVQSVPHSSSDDGHDSEGSDD